MARRTFDVVDIIEILVHWHAGRSKSEIAQSLGVDRKTAGKYIGAAVAAGMSPGGPPVTEERWAELVREWFPELADTRLRQVTWPAIGAHHEFVTGQLKAGVTVATIHQRLRDERGLAVSVASLRRYVAANLPEETRRSQVKVLRPWPAEPGAEAQIDYGRLPSARSLVKAGLPSSFPTMLGRRSSACSPCPAAKRHATLTRYPRPGLLTCGRRSLPIGLFRPRHRWPASKGPG